MMTEQQYNESIIPGFDGTDEEFVPKNTSSYIYGIEDKWETEQGIFTFHPATKWSGCKVYLSCAIETNKFEAFKIVEKEMDKYMQPLDESTENRGYPVYKSKYEFGASSETPLIVYCKVI